jgi:hypothetical protein
MQSTSFAHNLVRRRKDRLLRIQEKILYRSRKDAACEQVARGAGPLAKKATTPELFPRAIAKGQRLAALIVSDRASQVAASFFFFALFFLYLFLSNKYCLISINSQLINTNIFYPEQFRNFRNSFTYIPKLR